MKLEYVKLKTVEEAKATHTIKDGVIKPIDKPTEHPLAGFIGDTKHLMEFSDDEKIWREGYLLNISPRDHCIYKLGIYVASGLHSIKPYEYCRPATRHWHAHDGQSECPIPEGIGFRVRVINRQGNNEWMEKDLCKNSREPDIWMYSRGSQYLNVVAYQFLGCDGTKTNSNNGVN